MIPLVPQDRFAARPRRRIELRFCAEGADARYTALQHADEPPRAAEARASGRSAHLHLRPHGLRLRAHREFPHVHVSGHSAPLPAFAGLSRDAGDERDRRGRPHHPSRRGRGHRHPRVHRKIHPGLPRGYRRAAHRDARGARPRHRPHRRHGRADRKTAEKGPHLHERRLDLLPHREISGLRKALENRRHRHAGGRARGRRSVRKRRRPRFRAVEGAQARRAFLGDAHRPRPPRLAHRMLRDGHEISRRHARHSHRRRRPRVSAPRKRNRAERSGDREAVRPPSGCTPSI